jgi:predicted nucleotidyltransferase
MNRKMRNNFSQKISFSKKEEKEPHSLGVEAIYLFGSRA